MRLLLTTLAALAVSALAAFLALFVCALAGFAQVTLEHGILAAVPMAVLSLLVNGVASRSRAALKISLRLLVALSLLPLAAIVVADLARSQPSWMQGWDSASAAVTAVTCCAIALGQWAVFRWRASRTTQSPPMRFGRQT